MTRARQHLHLVVPQRFHVTNQAAFGGRHVYASISRFLPDAVQDLFEHVVPARPELARGADAAMATPAVDLGARVRAAWQ
jgi:DNA helicase-2/ATP-dependent DNA helicase PcrA